MIICDESTRALLMAIQDLNDEELQVFFDDPERLKEFCADFSAERSLAAVLPNQEEKE